MLSILRCGGGFTQLIHQIMIEKRFEITIT